MRLSWIRRVRIQSWEFRKRHGATKIESGLRRNESGDSKLLKKVQTRALNLLDFVVAIVLTV